MSLYPKVVYRDFNQTPGAQMALALKEFILNVINDYHWLNAQLLTYLAWEYMYNQRDYRCWYNLGSSPTVSQFRVCGSDG